MISNLERYKKDLETLISKGQQLHIAIQRECFPKEAEASINKQFGMKAKDIINALPSFIETYQSWYSEALALIKLLLPDRLGDFTRHYDRPKSRKEISYGNYVIEDYLQGIRVTRGPSDNIIVGPEAAIPHFRQQLSILQSAIQRFESSLFDIRQLLQADLFDSELEAARELAKKKFTRAAGALAGVVLERHLAQICANHKVKFLKKDPGISDLNNLLKDSNVIDVPQWRFIQHLADIRNLCDHNKRTEPSISQVDDLLEGVTKVTKTLF